MVAKVNYEFSIAPLRMERCIYPIVHLQASPRFGNRTNPDAPMSMDTAIEDIKIELVPNDATRFLVYLSVKITWPGAEIPPYEDARMQAVGFFCVEPTVDEETKTKHAVIGAPSMLYASIRERFRALTASGPWGEVILPGMIVKVNAMQAQEAENAKKD